MKNFIKQNWQTEAGENQNVVLSSRIRLARNFKAFKFPNQCDYNDKKEILNFAKEKLNLLSKEDYEFYLMENLSEIERKVMHEKYLISKDHALNPFGKALFFSDKDHLSIMINEEDHLRIQILHAGLEFSKIWNKINRVDNLIDQNINYAFSEKWGYLTSCPTNIGTALRASVMCHLPGLVFSGRIDNILAAINKFGLTVRGFSGEGSISQGNLYQISNQITLGYSEEEIIEKLKSIVDQIIAEELTSREYLLRNNYIELKDSVQRAFGILKYAYQLEEAEALNYLSKISFGHDTALIKEELSNNFFAKMLFLIRDAHLQVDKKLTKNKLNIKRAKIIKNNLVGSE